MNELKVSTLNCEWMLSFFGAPRDSDWLADPKIPETFAGTTRGSIRLEGIGNVPDLCQRLADVIRTIDPDVLFVEEGPPLVEQMQLFVKLFLGDAYAVHRSNRDNQAVFGLVRRTLSEKVRPWAPGGAQVDDLWKKIPRITLGDGSPRTAGSFTHSPASHCFSSAN